MSTITLRATKGSPLTNTEVDTNFSNLNTDKIESTYSGAMNSLTGGTSIATLGTVTTGTWSATAIGATKGGTGQTTYATGDILYASASNTLSKLAKPATASYLKMAADGTPSWDTLGLDDITATGTVTTGTWNATAIAPAYGGTGVANGSNNTITFTGNFTLGVTLSGNTSVTFPTSGTLVNTSVTSLSSLATVGTITSGTWNAGVIAGQYGGTGVANTGKTITLGGNLTTSGAYASTFTMTGATSVTFPTSGTLATTSSTMTGTWNGTAIGSTYGGTGLTSYTTGDLIYSSSGNTLSKLGVGSSGQVLTVSGGVPSWQTSTAATTGKAIAMAMVFGG